MLGSGILDLVLGMVFIYLLLSLLCSTINEMIAGIFNRRGKMLERALSRALGPRVAAALYKEPSISALSAASSFRTGITSTKDQQPNATPGLDENDFVAVFEGPAKPAYIAPDIFAGAIALLPFPPQAMARLLIAKGLISAPTGNKPAQWPVNPANNGAVANQTDTGRAPAPQVGGAVPNTDESASLTSGTPPSDPGQQPTTAQRNAPEAQVQQGPSADVPNQQSDQAFRLALAGPTILDWYQAFGDRLTGRYKKVTQIWLFVIAAAAATAMNVDTIRIYDSLSSQPSAASTIAASATVQAATLLNPKQTAGTTQQVKDEITDLSQVFTKMNLPLGWDGKDMPKDQLAWFYKFCGLLLSVLAASLGAPFWFDVLNKMGSLQLAGPNPSDPKKPA